MGINEKGAVSDIRLKAEITSAVGTKHRAFNSL